MCVHSCKSQKRALDPLELELLVVVSHFIRVLGTELWSFGIVSCALNSVCIIFYLFLSFPNTGLHLKVFVTVCYSHTALFYVFLRVLSSFLCFLLLLISMA